MKFRPMLRSVLEDRFQLVLRSESRLMPVYNLVPNPHLGGLAKAGPATGLADGAVMRFLRANDSEWRRSRD